VQLDQQVQLMVHGNGHRIILILMETHILQRHITHRVLKKMVKI